MNKSELRTEMRRRRSAMTADDVAAASAAIQARLMALKEFAVARAVFIYVSHRNEVATHRLIDILVAEGRRVAVPWIDADGTMHAVPFPGWKAMRCDRRGFLAPTIVVRQDRSGLPPLPPGEGRGEGEAPSVETLDLCIAPGLAFTPAGARLGQGGGHYDRFLAQRPGLPVIGLCYERQVVETLPSEPTDRPVDMIVTERRVLRWVANRRLRP